MSLIRTNAAAALLGVSSNTLRSWESRFGYPKPQRTEGGHRQFDLAEIEALRQAYAETQDIASAISVARERGEGPSTPTRLSAAFSEFSEEKADRLMEESMAVRSVERTVEMVLLPAVEAMSPDDLMLSRAPKPLSDGAEPGKGPASSPEYCFAWRYASGWLAAAQRVAPASTRDESVLIFDAGQSMNIDSLYVQALELFLRRAGLRVLTLPVELDSTRVGSALRALRPRRWSWVGTAHRWMPSDESCTPRGRAAATFRCSTIAAHCQTPARPRSLASAGPAEAVQMLRERLASSAARRDKQATPSAPSVPAAAIASRADS